MSSWCPTFLLSDERAELVDNVMVVRYRAKPISLDRLPVGFRIAGSFRLSDQRSVGVRIDRDSWIRVGNAVFREILRKRLYDEISRGFCVLHNNNSAHPSVFPELARDLAERVGRRRSFIVNTRVDFTRAVKLGRLMINIGAKIDDLAASAV